MMAKWSPLRAAHHRHSNCTLARTLRDALRPAPADEPRPSDPDDCLRAFRPPSPCSPFLSPSPPRRARLAMKTGSAEGYATAPPDRLRCPRLARWRRLGKAVAATDLGGGLTVVAPATAATDERLPPRPPSGVPPPPPPPPVAFLDFLPSGSSSLGVGAVGCAASCAPRLSTARMYTPSRFSVTQRTHCRSGLTHSPRICSRLTRGEEG